MATERRELIAELGREFMRRLEAELPEGPLTLDEIETVVEDVARQQNALLEERLLQEQAPPPENQARCPECAGVARFKTCGERQVLTIHGLQRLRRRWYACTQCGHGFAPLDAQLQLADRTASRRVRAWQAHLASQNPFAGVPETLRLLRGLEVSASTVERTTVEVGAALRAAPRAAEPGLPAGAEAAPGDRLYLGVDGAYCPLREPWRKDGTLGKLVSRYGEAKVGVAYRTGQRDGLDESVRWCAYTATLQQIEGFTPEFVALAHAAGSATAPELVFLGDGALWIWSLAAQHFPRAVQIVDYWHMTEHLYRIAKAQFGADSAAAQQWVHDCQWYLDRDLPQGVLNRIAAWEPPTEEERELQEREFGYFEKNQERMRYQTFLAHGYHIGSGTIESACRRLVTQRLKCAGMHWREETAEAVLALRACLKSTAPPDLRCYA